MIAIAVFIITFIFIVSEKINRTVAAMIGAMFLLIIRFINEKML